MALKVEMRVMTNCQVGSGTGNGSRSANGLKARGGDTCITIQLNPLEATIAPDSLAALASYFVPEFEYPFYEHLVLDALNALTEGEGQIAAKLAYLVKRAGTGARLVTTSRLFPSNSLSLPSLSLLRSHDVWHVPCAYGMCYMLEWCALHLDAARICHVLHGLDAHGTCSPACPLSYACHLLHALLPLP